MKIIFLSNNLDITKPLANWLVAQGEEVIIYSEPLKSDFIQINQPDFLISYNYRYIIKDDVLEQIPNGKIINLHISYLPWNKGSHPNVWSFFENTPKGVTIHYIDKGLDTGNILMQKKLNLDENTETLESSYRKLHHEIQALFKSNWNRIKECKIISMPQDLGGTYHRSSDLKPLLTIFGDKLWTTTITRLKEYNIR